jgi:hypothetical protein
MKADRRIGRFVVARSRRWVDPGGVRFLTFGCLVGAFAAGPIPVALAEPVISTGALGPLVPAFSVEFNTTDGTFRVDGGPPVGGARFDDGRRHPRGRWAPGWRRAVR